MSNEKILTFGVSRELGHRARIAAAICNESLSKLLRRALVRELERLEKLSEAQEESGDEPAENRETHEDCPGS